VWERLGTDLAPRHLDAIGSRSVPLSQLDGAFAPFLAGKSRGRVLVDLHA
jgi:hypothetical protein